MRELKPVTENNGAMNTADDFDDIGLRVEALLNHAYKLIGRNRLFAQSASEEKMVRDWWQHMQDGLEKMKKITDEIRYYYSQPTVSEEQIDHELSVEENTEDESTINEIPEVQKETQMSEVKQQETQMSEIKNIINKLNILSGLPESMEATTETQISEVNELRRLLKFAGRPQSAIDEASSRFGNSVTGPKGEPRIMGDTIDFAAAGLGKAKSGRGDKGFDNVSDNPLDKREADLKEEIMKEFTQFKQGNETS